MAQQVTFRFPDGTRVRSASQRAYVLISRYTDRETGKVDTRIEKRSDSPETLWAERNRRKARGSSSQFFLGTSATAEVEVMI